MKQLSRMKGSIDSNITLSTLIYDHLGETRNII